MRSLGVGLVVAMLGVAGCASSSASSSGAARGGLSPFQVASGFAEGVIEYCVPSKVRAAPIGDWPAEERPGVAPAGPDTRGMAPENPDGPVWDVLSAQGIVIISERADGLCVVSAYGPPVRPTFDAIGTALTDEVGFAPLPDQRDPVYNRAFARPVDGRTVTVFLSGGEPGTPGHLSRFSVITAFVEDER